MSTLHIYQSNVGSRLILRSPLVQLAEQWRNRSGSTEPILLMTKTRVEELETSSRNFLLWPYETEMSESLISFITQRGGEITPNNRLQGITITGVSFALPWMEYENPESVGEPSDRAGVLEIVEFQAQFTTYIHMDSQVVQIIAKWKLDTSFTGPILLWSIVDTDEQPSHRSTRLLWPIEPKYVNSLLHHLEQQKKPPIYVSSVPNPGSYADPWGKVENLTFVFPGTHSPRTTTQREHAYAVVTRVSRESTTDEPASIEEEEAPAQNLSPTSASRRFASRRTKSRYSLEEAGSSDTDQNLQRTESSKFKAFFHRKKK
jgi:hypothetical protein